MAGFIHGLLDDLNPPFPARASILPLNPATDIIIPDFQSGNIDTAPTLQPLLYYATAPAREIRMVRDGSTARIEW